MLLPYDYRHDYFLVSSMLKLSSLKPSKYTRWIFASIGRFVTVKFTCFHIVVVNFLQVRLWCSLFATNSFHWIASIGLGSSVVPKISCLIVMDDSLESSDYYREPPGKAQRLKRKAISDCGITVLHPVILQNAEEKP